MFALKLILIKTFFRYWSWTHTQIGRNLDFTRGNLFGFWLSLANWRFRTSSRQFVITSSINQHTAAEQCLRVLTKYTPYSNRITACPDSQRKAIKPIIKSAKDGYKTEFRRRLPIERLLGGQRSDDSKLTSAPVMWL